MTNPAIEHVLVTAGGEVRLTPDDQDGVCIESLEPGTALNVHTVNSLYRIVVLDGPHHVVHICGGTAFPEDTVVRIEGATGYGSALKRGWIVVGFRMEMLLGPLRIKSSPVLSVLNTGAP